MGGRGSASHNAGGGRSVSYIRFQPESISNFLKSLAYSFDNRYDADSVFRQGTDDLWDSLTDMEKYAIWQYTAGSGGFNRPLSGYNKSWSDYDYVEPGKVRLGNENIRQGYLSGDFARITGSSGVNYEKAIYSLTSAIAKSQLEDNTYLYRGSGYDGLAGYLRDSMDFKSTVNLLQTGSLAEVKNALLGKYPQSHAFVSTGVSTESKFSGDVTYRIFAPAGTRGLYAEPQSKYGGTSPSSLYKKGKSKDGLRPDVGSEAEMILQRGTRFRITGVDRHYEFGMPVLDIDMEIVEQPDFKTYKERTHT